MRFTAFERSGRAGLGLWSNGILRGLAEGEDGFPGHLRAILSEGEGALEAAGKALEGAPEIDPAAIRHLPPVGDPEKIVCVGLNYRDHSDESGFEQPKYPTLFGRFNSSLVAHGAPIRRPALSEQLDYEGELVAVIGRTVKDVAEADALDCVAGYSVFNDASIRDYQFLAPQWTPGKNFDGTGAFGPDFVTADALPSGCRGLTLTTRLNGQTVQSAPIDDMVFDVATTISLCSKFMTLRPGDLIVTGTPSGVGLARKPPLWMKAGDVCEVEIDGVGLLSNPVEDAA